MIQVELHDRANGLVKVLSGAKNAAFHAVLNSDGAGSFLIHRADPDAAAYGISPAGTVLGCIVHLLRKGPLEATYTDRFSFQVESVTIGLDQNEEANAWYTVAGRGTLSLLEDRICWPPGFDGVNASSISNQWQIYASVTGGAIMDAELDRSASRFTPTITHSVQTTTIPQTAKLRFDNLRLLHDYLVKTGPMDAQMYGLDYRCVDVRGTDRSATVQVQLAAQDSLLGVQMALDAKAVKNWVVAQGTGEGINTLLAVATDAPAIASLRRREGFLDARQVDAQGQLALTAAGSLAQFKTFDKRITTKFADSAHTQLYRDFDLGDTIGLAVQPLGSNDKYRVVGIQVADVDAEVEDVSLDLNSMRQEYLIKLLQGTVLPTVSSLNVLNRMPQGAPQIDTQTYPDDCDPTHPFHFDFYLASNIVFVNYAKLSFFLRAFRRPLAAAVGSSTSSGASSASSSDVPPSAIDHTHTIAVDAITSTLSPVYFTLGKFQSFEGPTSEQTSSPDTGLSHSHPIPHTHTFVPNLTLTDGIFETTVATGVKVTVNGTDRTATLGGGTGFTANQTELALSVAWLNLGAWNTIDLTPTGLGRITGHLTIVSYIQSV